jgi:hypothetical protein
LSAAQQSSTPAAFLSQSEPHTVSNLAMLERLEGTLEEHEVQLLDLNRFHEKLTREYNEKVRLTTVAPSPHS